MLSYLSLEIDKFIAGTGLAAVGHFMLRFCAIYLRRWLFQLVNQP